MYDGQEDPDSLVWEKNDEDWARAFKKMRLKSTCRQVAQLAEREFGKPATHISPLIGGGFNMLYRVRVEGLSPDVMVRLPFSSLAPFLHEKTIQEAATAKYIAKNTQVPIPRHFFHGRDPDLGPFIIMERVESQGTMSARLTTPSDDPSVQHVLNPDIPEATLVSIWSKAAACLLQLSRLTFPRIGALAEANGDSYAVAGRPITHNMTDMVRLAHIPVAVLPPEGKTFESADEWYVALAEMHLAQLIFQHNDAVSSEDDCRNKFVARQLFRKLAKAGRLSSFGFAEDDWSVQSSTIASGSLSPAPSGSGQFRIWGDDFRAGNLLLDGADELAAAIDWEFTYAGPTQFTLDPPWWLLLDLPETWSPGIDDWTNIYDARLNVWLAAMKRAELDLEGPGPFPVPLSTYMRESWETGRFWLSYGARKSWAFDAVYWTHLDERFFGDRDSRITKDKFWRTRVHLLTDAENAGMDYFVRRKMYESKNRIIVDWDPMDAKQRLREMLYD